MATKDTGIVNIHGKEYKTVASRVQAFREKFPADSKDNFAIVTEIVERTAEEVVMKASIILSGNLIATGYAEEKRTSSQINRTSALENAETSAIGRALAAFGMAGSEYASADEVAQAIHQQSTPQPATPAKSAAPTDDKLATAKRDINEGLESLAYEHPAQKKAFVMSVLSKSSIDTIEEAHEVMDAIDIQLSEKEAA